MVVHKVLCILETIACSIAGTGDVKLAFSNGTHFMLHDVRHVPKLKKNLVSTGQLDDQGYYTVFGDSRWKITKGARVIEKGYKCDTLYALHVSHVKNHVVAVTEVPKKAWPVRTHEC